MARTAAEEAVAMTRNAVGPDAAGGRTWRGAVTNRSEAACRDVAVEVCFLDAQGRPVGKVTASVEWLEAGRSLDLRAPLPDEAVVMQVQALQWRAAGEGRLLGPWEPWAFGRLCEG